MKTLKTGVSLVAFAIAMAFAAPATADSILVDSDSGNSTEGLGSFTGSIDYSFNGTYGMLTVMLTNTSDAANGGFITGVVMDAAGDYSASLESAVPLAFEFVEDANAEPFGNPYAFGAAVGGNFLGGGNPSDGIGVGETGTLVFQIDGPDAGFLMALDFLSSPNYDFGLVVRFRGFEDGGSDKVPGRLIPLPPPVAMGAFGLLAVMAGQRRVRRTIGG